MRRGDDVNVIAEAGQVVVRPEAEVLFAGIVTTPLEGMEKEDELAGIVCEMGDEPVTVQVWVPAAVE